MSVTRWILGAGLVGAGLAMQACGDSVEEPPVPGTAVVSLSTATTDGALLVRVTGPGFDAPQAAASGTVLHWRQVSETELVVAVFGAIGSGSLFRMEIPDRAADAEYVGTVLQVAGRDDALRTDLSGYTIRIATAETP